MTRKRRAYSTPTWETWLLITAVYFTALLGAYGVVAYLMYERILQNEYRLNRPIRPLAALLEQDLQKLKGAHIPPIDIMKISQQVAPRLEILRRTADDVQSCEDQRQELLNGDGHKKQLEDLIALANQAYADQKRILTFLRRNHLNSSDVLAFIQSRKQEVVN